MSGPKATVAETREPTGLPPRQGCEYTAFWCEENIARFLSRLELAGREAYAMVISNADRSFGMFHQRAGRGDSGEVAWDYHVAALIHDASGYLVCDLDSRLAFPCSAARWLELSFDDGLPASMAPKFRLITASDYVNELSSDRSHMRGPDGNWNAPPPPWPPYGADRSNNLMEWVDVFNVAGINQSMRRACVNCMADKSLNVDVAFEFPGREHLKFNHFGSGNPCVVTVAVGFKCITCYGRSVIVDGMDKIHGASSTVSTH